MCVFSLLWIPAGQPKACRPRVPAPGLAVLLKSPNSAMKRCPECHFTFEDRVMVCDFDGSKLTDFADPEPLSDRIVPPSRMSNLLRFATSRSGLVGLAGLLVVSGTFLIVRHKSSSPPKLDEEASTVERRDSIVSTTRTRKSRRRVAYAHKLERRSRTTIARASTARRVSTATRTTARVRSSSNDFNKRTVAVSEKKDSKVNVVLKKTGNALKKTVSILRKPFDF
jgi:hypothetical protein